MKIWKVLDGPYCLDDDIDGAEILEEEWPDRYWIVVMATLEGSDDPYEVEVFFGSFDDAYNFKLASDRSLEHIAVEHTDE